ncbi:MAG: NusA-like transcription termination signal-binding factor [Candidatus Aenigmarchaeota archaeon]|nr:NusA-like transcription termination signal-binding factor [Candidatus Aenigmarchaeota archaeon]
MRTLENDELQAMAIFENILKAHVRDCILDDESIYYIAEAGSSLGKKVMLIKKLQERVQKKIRVFEFSDDNERFVKNMIPRAKKIEIMGKRAVVTLEDEDKAMTIGKNGSNIKKIRLLLARNSPIEGVDIK